MAEYTCVGDCGARVSAKNKRCRKCAGVLRRKHARPGGAATGDAGAMRVPRAGPADLIESPAGAAATDTVTVVLGRRDAEELAQMAENFGAQRVARAAGAKDADVGELRRLVAAASGLLASARAIRRALAV